VQTSISQPCPCLIHSDKTVCCLATRHTSVLDQLFMCFLVADPGPTSSLTLRYERCNIWPLVHERSDIRELAHVCKCDNVAAGACM
jgi:hypothetical protein